MDHYDKIVNIIEKPYINNLISMGISDIHYKEIFSRLYNEIIIIKLNGLLDNGAYILNEKRQIIYYEYPDGFWKEWKYDNNGYQIYFEDSEGFIRDNNF
jgi:hypothetical protein